MLSPHASARLYEAISHFTEQSGGSSNAANIRSYVPEILTLPSHRHRHLWAVQQEGHDEIQNMILDSIVVYLTVIIHVCLISHFG